MPGRRPVAGRAVVAAILSLGTLVGGVTPGDSPAAVADVARPVPTLPPQRPGFSIGAVLVTPSPGWAVALPVGPARSGALILGVLPDSPASRARLAPGEVIVQIDGHDVADAGAAARLFRGGARSYTVSVVGPTGTRSAALAPTGPFMSAEDYFASRLDSDDSLLARYLAVQNMASGPRALSLAKVLASMSPAFAQGHALLARVQWDVVRASGKQSVAPQDVQAVVDELATATQLDADSSEIWASTAQVLLDLKANREAEDAATKAVNLDPQSATAQSLLGRANLALGENQSALEHLYRAVQLDPYDYRKYNDLGHAYQASGMDHEAGAVAALSKALQVSSTRPQPRPGPAIVGLSALVLAAAFMLITRRGVPFLEDPVLDERRSSRRTPVEPSRRLAALELLGAVALVNSILPFAAWVLAISRPLGPAISVLGYIVPGAVLLVVTALTHRDLMLHPAAPALSEIRSYLMFGCGIWVTFTHIPVIALALGRGYPVLALLSAAMGPLMIGLTIWFKRLTTAEVIVRV